MTNRSIKLIISLLNLKFYLHVPHIIKVGLKGDHILQVK